MSKLSFQGPATISFRSGGGAKPSQIGRGSARGRGYDSAWDRLSKAWRLGHPHCAECAQRGSVRRCDLVDHMVPVADQPELRLDRNNIWSLCQHCHDTVKRELEREAREIGHIGILPKWCRDPLLRPIGLRYAPVVKDNGSTGTL